MWSSHLEGQVERDNYLLIILAFPCKAQGLKLYLDAGYGISRRMRGFSQVAYTKSIFISKHDESLSMARVQWS